MVAAWRTQQRSSRRYGADLRGAWQNLRFEAASAPARPVGLCQQRLRPVQGKANDTAGNLPIGRPRSLLPDVASVLGFKSCGPAAPVRSHCALGVYFTANTHTTPPCGTSGL